MIVEASEIIFIKKNFPHGMMRILADNIKWDYQKVRGVFNYIKDEVDDELITEARRLLKVNIGVEYKPTEVTEA